MLELYLCVCLNHSIIMKLRICHTIWQSEMNLFSTQTWKVLFTNCISSCKDKYYIVQIVKFSQCACRRLKWHEKRNSMLVWVYKYV